MTQSEEGGLVPVDSFRVRLAIVRALMGWNYEEAQEATGINAESWRLWEKGARNCSTKTEVAAVIAQVTPYSKQWIAFGGPLRKEDAGPLLRRSPKATSTRRVSSGSNGQLMSPTRVLTRNYLVTGNIAAA